MKNGDINEDYFKEEKNKSKKSIHVLHHWVHVYLHLAQQKQIYRKRIKKGCISVGLDPKS